ncbi:MAG: zinc-binding alcohol dehydrogenase family protein [Aquirufa sp.]
MINQLICLEPGKFHWQKVEKPKRKLGEVLIKVRWIGICGTDLHAFEGTQPFFSYPRVLGHEVSGEIVETEADEADFILGDQVAIIPYIHCGKCAACCSGKTNCCQTLSVIGVHQNGAMVEYISVPKQFVIRANDIPLKHLAMVEPLSIGAHGIRRAGVKENDFVLIIGAGPIGLAAMAFARIKGAQVIALDFNQNRLDFCQKEWQVDYVIHGKEDVSARLMEITAGTMPQIVIDATGNLNAINNGFQYLSHGGNYTLIGLQLGQIQLSHPDFHKKEGTLMSSRNATREDFEYVIECLRNQQIDLSNYISKEIDFMNLPQEFNEIPKPENKIIKAVVEF